MYAFIAGNKFIYRTTTPTDGYYYCYSSHHASPGLSLISKINSLYMSALSWWWYRKKKKHRISLSHLLHRPFSKNKDPLCLILLLPSVESVNESIVANPKDRSTSLFYYPT